MATPGEILDHDGVRLRRWLPADAEVALAAVVESIDHLKPWMVWAVDGYGRAETEAFLARCQTEWGSGEAYNYAIVAADGEVIGSCGLMARIGPGGLEIGYWLHPRHTGQGIATRAAAALTAEAFRAGADRVEIVHDVANERSGRVPRRLGFAEVCTRKSDEPVGGSRTGMVKVWRRTAELR